jgi:hypothetical protein
MDTLARGLLYDCCHSDTSCGGSDRAMHIRALAGANVVHLFIFRRALLLFQVAHVGGLFLLGLSLDSLAMMQNQCQAWLNHALYVVFCGRAKNDIH